MGKPNSFTKFFGIKSAEEKNKKNEEQKNYYESLNEEQEEFDKNLSNSKSILDNSTSKVKNNDLLSFSSSSIYSNKLKNNENVNNKTAILDLEIKIMELEQEILDIEIKLSELE